MKRLSRLFSKTPTPPPPPTAEQRKVALQSSTGEVIAETALSGDDASLRVAAIRLLPDGEPLRRLAGLADPPGGAVETLPAGVRHAAQERLAQLVDEGSIDNDPAVLAMLALEGPSTRVRQSAASAIEDPELLHELLPRVRGKDKAAYRIIRQKCDAIAAERRKMEEAAREAADLCASIERHSEQPHDTLYAATLEALTTRWGALPARPEPGFEQRVERAMERCREVIAGHKRETARQEAERAAELAAEQEAREARERALEVERRAADEQAESERRAAAEQAEADAKAQAEVAAAHESEDQARAEQRAREAQARSQVGRLIRLSSDALQQGNTRKAARFRLAIEDALQGVPAVPPYLVRNLQHLDERLNELRQWKDYVAAPKRIELIEEMEALAGSQEEPEALAEHIRSLQQEWRTINKGIASDTSTDGERFLQACQAAYKPCQEYFAAQAAVRRENLEARKQVLERLKAFEASQEAEGADRRLLLQVLREAPREWRSHSPVDRVSSRTTEIAFHRSMDRLRKMLKAWYEGNEADKKALIAQARNLSTAEDEAQAIDGVKRLQAMWRETGPVSRDQSQALWDEFRGLCDMVYKRREHTHALHVAGLEAAKKKAIALCELVEQAAGASAAERSPASAKIREWRAAFDELGEMPRADAWALRDRFEQAVAQYEDELARQDLQDAETAVSNLFEAGRHIRAYERAVMNNAPVAECDALRNTAEGFIAGVRRWPNGGLQAVKQALDRAASGSDPDDGARERALRMLCIRSEIHSSTSTPPEDQELRRDYQMSLLLAGLGQTSQMDDRDWDAMLAEWIGIGAIAPEAHEELERRFMRCLGKRPIRNPRGSAFKGHDGGNAHSDRDAGGRRGRRDGRGRPDSVARR